MNIIVLLGAAFLLIGGILLLIEAFKTSILWGLGCLFITPISLIFIFAHWDRAKNPFILQLIGLALVLSRKFL